METKIEEELARESKALQTRQKTDLNLLKQTIEREKQELQTKLRSALSRKDVIEILFDSRADMLADVQLDQENNTNIQIRLLQIKHEFDEV